MMRAIYLNLTTRFFNLCGLSSERTACFFRQILQSLFAFGRGGRFLDILVCRRPLFSTCHFFSLPKEPRSLKNWSRSRSGAPRPRCFTRGCGTFFFRPWFAPPSMRLLSARRASAFLHRARRRATAPFDPGPRLSRFSVLFMALDRGRDTLVAPACPRS